MKIKTFIQVCIAFFTLLLITACDVGKPTLRIYTWSDYMDMDLVKEFEKEFNCKVIIDYFDSNELMLTKIKSGGTGYDIITPSSYMVEIMRDQNLLNKLELSKIPNAKFVDKKYLDTLALDKNMEFSVPYMIGYSCIAYNKSRIPNIPDSWGLFDTDKFGNRNTLLNDIRETVGAALKYKGYSINTKERKELQEAKDVLLTWRKNIVRFENEAYKSGIESGEFYIVMGYKGDLIQVINENKSTLGLMIPKEGVSISCDDWVIPVGAKNSELAYLFINFMCKPESAATNMILTSYTSPILEGFKFLPEDVRNSPIYSLPPEEILKKSEVIRDVGDYIKFYNEVWDAVKSN